MNGVSDVAAICLATVICTALVCATVMVCFKFRRLELEIPGLRLQVNGDEQ